MPELPPPPPAPAATWKWLADFRARSNPALVAIGGVVAVLVLGGVGWSALREGGGVREPPELTMPRAGSSDDPGVAPGRSDAGGTAAGGRGERVVVHVAGAVANPGVYRLGGDPRVADAIDAAGGPVNGADIDAVNLAAKVADGERVYLPRRGEVLPPALNSIGVPPSRAGPIDLNTATADQLDDLPGVGPATAEAIIAYRTEHGRFRTVDELMEVRGIGAAKFAALRSKVSVR